MIDLVDGPTEEGDVVRVGWTATYQAPGAPPFVLRGRSVARVREGVIVELADDYPDGTDAEAGAWIVRHAPGADASYV